MTNGRLRLTDGASNEASSAFTSSAQNISTFSTQFTFQLTNAIADGFAFVIQGVSPTALGGAGGYLGYAGIGSSLAIKFDLYNNAGEGSDSTGLYTNGVNPFTPSVDLSSSGINLHSGDTFQVSLNYNGSTLTEAITDTNTGASFSYSYSNVNLTSLVGSSTAYVGFTAGTGGSSAIQDILSWSFTPGTGGASGTGGTGGATGGINDSSFSSSSGLTLNGSATLVNGRLRLTNGGTNQASSAFNSSKVSVSSFSTQFTFQLTNAIADGFAFVIQGVSPTALGGAGGYLGYAGIGSSLAIKFDLYNNAGEGSDSTGLFVNGVNPFTPSVDLSSSGINLHSGDTFQVSLNYDGSTLTETITDTNTGATFSHAYTNVNIASLVGGSTAYAGFTAGTGGSTAIQDILSWTYTPTGSSVNISSFSSSSGLTLNGSTTLVNGRLRLTNGGTNQASSAFNSSKVSVSSFSTQFTFQLTSANADGFAFVIQGVAPTALGGAGGYLGYAGIGSSLAIKFDLYNNAGEGSDSTGLFVNGVNPFTPSVDLSSSGINLHSGDTFQVSLNYDGSTLTETITDTNTGATFSHAYTNVNIASLVGGSTAYAGFTAGTGGSTAVQDILSWTYTPTASAAPLPAPIVGASGSNGGSLPGAKPVLAELIADVQAVLGSQAIPSNTSATASLDQFFARLSQEKALPPALLHRTPGQDAAELAWLADFFALEAKH